ncbi:VOC family protein [Maritimibacter sp. UBA3975]|uniref:VOC family protein n=1 Tax=Maritimibacter sp. UBA3975 TaxID=1946833 RepID=UPI000C095EA2|nr:VOC family protein [Maritimibacter sp. UBA3975]MAM63269.1 glyoxalase [Maritimibacter sp.]|tara:strand:- start:73488 stop:73862 length:375 start_codon:yes stop_codon:yes gene_type:complete
MPSHIHFQTIGATDQARAVAFYTEKLGFSVERDEAYGADRWIFLTLPGAQTMLQISKVAAITPQDTPQLVLVCDDVDGEAKCLADADVPIVSGPDTAPWDPSTRWAMIHDSEGNLILLQTVGGQ